MTTERIEVQRPIAADPATIFSVISDPKGHVAIDRERHLARRHARQLTEVGGQVDADHGRVWTSTERTAGRSRMIGAQVSPASGDA